MLSDANRRQQGKMLGSRAGMMDESGQWTRQLHELEVTMPRLSLRASSCVRVCASAAGSLSRSPAQSSVAPGVLWI